MRVFTIIQLLLLFETSPARGQQCTEQDWSSTFGNAGDFTSQCQDDVSYVSGMRSGGYDVQLENGPAVIKAATCCAVNLPYSQEGNDCYMEEWWTTLNRSVMRTCRIFRELQISIFLKALLYTFWESLKTRTFIPAFDCISFVLFHSPCSEMTCGQHVYVMVISSTDFSPLGEISWLILGRVSVVNRIAIQIKTGPVGTLMWISQKMEQNSVLTGFS